MKFQKSFKPYSPNSLCKLDSCHAYLHKTMSLDTVLYTAKFFKGQKQEKDKTKGAAQFS